MRRWWPWIWLFFLLWGSNPAPLQAAQPETSSTKASKKEVKPTTITADRLEVSRKLHRAVYSGDVVLRDQENNLTIFADQMEFLFDEKMEEVQRAVASGNVRIDTGEQHGSAERAEYFPGEQKAVLTGNPKVWQNNDMVSGSRIILFFKDDRAIAESDGKTRVQAVIYPKKGQEKMWGLPERRKGSKEGGR